MNQEYLFEVSPEDEAKRLDIFIKEKLPQLSRSRIQTLIKENYVLVNFKPSKASYKIKRGEKIKVFIPPDREIEIQPRDIPFEIIYEDEDIAVINKPSGIVVHPAPGHYDDTLVHGLILKLKNLSGIGGKIRPGIVHRLDKDTSGIMLVAKNDFAHKKLVEAFKERLIEKNYIALVYGRLTQKKGKIETFIGRHPIARKKMAVLKEGKLAITFYEVLEIFNKASLVLAKPVTGRTHQIRVQFSYIGHPILGDPIYGGLKHNLPKPPRLMLHAYEIVFKHPRTNEEMKFRVPIPEEFQSYIEKLKDSR
ncbi:pseudouridine synthase, RluA family [Thermodesulfobacterium geofontis OPF15]|jgi:23S rRNA pseudouridine1911/1915/1917 synthase|uniref:Pseudouridine synthase n=1 Tax=Thermodesulfobacterium geofontis (strain OPF15) TaxID=795359 RepID=F8C2I2_THEGP|nr:RluA family pseudouridine synthase [Thermodesulfobacterium geofontis]AEH22274.1 pseudouridine synthase, RluA family [Thermodesulfobacterium geofontis OPF15]